MIAGLASCVCALAPAVPAHAGDARTIDYVALGDSAAAGPLIPAQDPSRPGCFRSRRNYPSLTAAALNVRSFTDVTCTSAETTDLTRPQSTLLGRVPPQFDALTEGTDLVTVHLGANDISLFRMVAHCLALGANPDPCRYDYREDGHDTWESQIKALAPAIDGMLDGIRERAPHARIVVVGYPAYLPHGGCYPTVPILPGDATYVQQTVDRLNAMLAQRARAAGADYVDLAGRGSGHTACASPADRWVEPYIPASLAVPFHPNATGMRAFAQILVSEL
ncbi:SGNH/GDSL hydrolase family protein [Actinomadura sp. 3N407]|uniref:SGNH/GDSL hydrolase family protein n=1 Tax=Actinomadura sp. 3N407 TaxID=3457423 RepID=UPI003FCCB26E